MTTDTKAVARWDAVGPDMAMDESSGGAFVLFTDHERVVGELESKIVTGGAISGAAIGQITKLAIERDTLRAALAASRAEADGLKSERDGLIELANRSANGIRKATGEYNRLHAELEELKKDAERYRWLRDSAPEEWDVTRWLDREHQEVHVQDYLDEAIDAAMENGNV